MFLPLEYREQIKPSLPASSFEVPSSYYVLPPQIWALKCVYEPEEKTDRHGPAQISVRDESGTIGRKGCDPRDADLGAGDEKKDNDQGIRPVPYPQR